jgi:hypothetical protein
MRDSNGGLKNFLKTGRGTKMKPTTQELAIINSRLPGTTLGESQVEVLPFRLFDNQLTDRYTIMSPEMMKKLMMDANNGMIAFNSMHQSRSTLPVGRSIAGQIVKNGAVTELQVKLYAVTQRPDGTPMEDGKDLADRYNTGAVYACSAGVSVGFYKCSICGNDIRDYMNCDHFPGETYTIDEKPVIATALMTGHDIRDGAAMDCGAYECSAVTAGGVRNASILSESFSRYDKGVDLKEFKKEAFDGKQIAEHVTLMPYAATTIKEEVHMGEQTQEKDLLAKNYELVADKAKIEVKLAQTEGEFNLLKQSSDALSKTLETTQAEFAQVKTDLTGALAQVEEFTKKVTDLEAAGETSKTEYEAKIAEADAKVEESVAFKTAYVALVEADGVKINATVTDYASKTVVELQALHAEYLVEIAKLPSGQLTQGDDAGDAPTFAAYDGIPSDMYKTK